MIVASDLPSISILVFAWPRTFLKVSKVLSTYFWAFARGTVPRNSDECPQFIAQRSWSIQRGILYSALSKLFSNRF